jgi:hypothetical protein
LSPIALSYDIPCENFLYVFKGARSAPGRAGYRRMETASRKLR